MFDIFLIILAAEERRKYPPSKVVSIIHDKEKYHYVSSAIKPKLLSDQPGNLVISHYAVTFEETIILRSSDLQFNDKGKTGFSSISFCYSFYQFCLIHVAFACLSLGKVVFHIWYVMLLSFNYHLFNAPITDD